MRTGALVLGLAWSLVGSCAWGASKKEARAFVQELQAAVKANRKVLASGEPLAIRNHYEWYRKLSARGSALFGGAGECSFAAGTAGTLWDHQRQYSRKPDQLGYALIQKDLEEYDGNLKLCRESIAKMR